MASALDHKLTIDTAEAEARAIKNVARMLQRPDQLEKVDQFHKQIERKRMGVESRLKTAVQSQLDGVKTGIDQLSVALGHVREVKAKMGQVEALMDSAFQDRHIKEIKEISAEHRQLGAAMENLRQIFTVPESIQEIRNHLKQHDLLQAHKILRELEHSRDELLYEQHKLEHHSQADIKLLQRYFNDVTVVSNEMFKVVASIITNALQYAKEKPELLVAALRLVEREQVVDGEVERKKTYSGYVPPGRPKQWRDMVMESLKTSTEHKLRINLDNNKEGALGKALTEIRFAIVDDLVKIKHLVANCFPPQYDIFERFVRWYHLALSNEIARLTADPALEGNSIIQVLIFINSYMSDNFMGSAELAIAKEKLPDLLDPSQQERLVDQYFAKTKTDMAKWLDRSLASETELWLKCNDGDEPNADDRGYLCTDLPIVLYKMCVEVLKVAAGISAELKNRVYEVVIDEMATFAESFTTSMGEYKTKHLADRGSNVVKIKYYHQYMVASINNCRQISDNFAKIQTELEIESEAAEVNPFGQSDADSKITQIMSDIAHAGCKMLCEEVLIDLKPWFDKLLTKDDWLDNMSGGPCQTICVTVEDYSQDFSALQPDYLFYLLVELERLVAVEYIKAIISKRLKFNPSPYENELERKQTAEQILTEADQLKSFFQKLSNSRDSPALDAIKSMADLIKSSPDMVELELSSLVSRYADVTADHIRALLTLRGDISSAEAKNIIESSLQNRKKGKNAVDISLFSEVTVQTGFFSR